MKLRNEIGRLPARAGLAGSARMAGLKNQNSAGTRNTKKSRLLAALITAGTLLGPGNQGFAQSGQFLPVYHVVQPGASQAQANTLAADLGVPTDQLTVSNGMVYYVDPANFMNIPTMPVTDPNAISTLLAQTVNQSSNFPITLEQIDFGSLSNRVVLDDASAQAFAMSALSDSGLTPQFGAAHITHATLNTYMNLPGGGVSSNSQFLDTQVNYQFVDTNGYPFSGPGAQVQMSFDGAGNATRLVYAWRQVTPGQQVQIIPESVARSRVAGLFPAGTQLADDIEYICPPFWPHWKIPCLTCPPPPPIDVENILPYYVFHGSIVVTNPVDGQITQVQSLTQAIPATDDPAFVPALNLSISNRADGSVGANVAVSGGTGPYMYSWSGSSGSVPSNNVPSFNYLPVVRIEQPQLQIQSQAGGSANISWVQGPQPLPWILESSPMVAGDPASWSQVPGSIQNNNGTYSMIVSNITATRFFRLRLANSTVPITETVNVTVTDMNGVSVQANQNLIVQATPIQLTPATVVLLGPCHPQWGTSSPVDPGLGSTDRSDWRARMLVDPGAGTETYLWTLNSAWEGDFLDPVVPHVLGPNPQTSGDDDYRNWGVDGADITLYIGHGNPTVFTFSVTPALFFNNPKLVHSWGDDADFGYHPATWLCLLSCEVLSNNWAGLTAAQRWGGAFDGLHILTGFQSLAWAGTGFPATFADNMLLGAPQTVVKSWFNSAMLHGTGQAAALGPIGPGGSLDFNDHYWCKGPVGPTIKAGQIQGWWYVSQ